jgi:hypothetical protein
MRAFSIFHLEQDERGGDNTVEVLSAINMLTESESKHQPLCTLRKPSDRFRHSRRE